MLINVLDIGIKENEFWEMTVGEVNRAVESYNRVRQRKLQDRASLDYALAALIGKHVSIVLGDKSGVPDIKTVYPTLFNDDNELKEREEKLAKQKLELSALRFKQYAQFHNNKFKGGAKDK